MSAMKTSLQRLILLLAAVHLGSGQERIVGGSAANIENYPWLVNLRYQGAPACGGAIIAPQWILTACHCFPDEHSLTDYDVTAGTTNLEPTDPSAQSMLIDSVQKYPGYNTDTYMSDIALIKLRTPLTFGTGVSSIRLLSADVQIPAGLTCTIAGWGNVRHGVSLDNPKPLQTALVSVVSRRTCQCLHNINATPGELTTIQSDMICAGNKQGSVDACQGDSGGPLSCYINNKWYQIGVVSWGDECGAPNRPGVYVKPSPYLGWIQSYVPDCQVDSITIDQQPTPDEEQGCQGSDGNYYPYPNRGSVFLATFISLPLYWLTTYLLTNL